MCGIAGFRARRALPRESLEALVGRITDRLSHRGPDDAGAFVDVETQVALGFRRLSIIDLSREGHQPMRSPSGRYYLVFNGEIYNFNRLRSELEKLDHHFRGHSDTEVLLAAIEQWGLVEALRRANGMFALALWDRARRELSLVRDRAGKKPLYFGWTKGFFAFASELKAIRALPGFDAPINRDALTLFLRHNYIQAPYSIYEGIFKLCAGEILTLPLEKLSQPQTLEELATHRQMFWTLADVIREGVAHPFAGDERQASVELESHLKAAVEARMVADVPVGALLSGGIDSSTVTALMQSVSSMPIKTFSIGFHEKNYNEAGYAQQVAKHLGTDHTELYVSPEEARDVIPRLPAIFDEPLADVSQIPTFLVSQLARRKVTVALSGDGGDELFGGYDRYFFAKRVLSPIARFPSNGRRLLAAAVTGVSPQRWDNAFQILNHMLPQAARVSRPGDKLHKLVSLLHRPDAVGMYRDLFSHWRDPEAVVRAGREPPTRLTDASDWPPVRGFIERMMQLDFVTYLSEDILAKVDRASMAVSLEVRCPILDPEVIAFAWRLPLRLKVRQGQGKWPLRQVLYRHVPRELVERPKMGFDVPMKSWLRGPLRGWAEELLDPVKLRQDGLFNPAPIREKWSEHLQGYRNWQYPLWDVLMFQAWLEHERRDRESLCSREHAADAIES
jgi:asparagine synthase (glutamine-hydrolysing)